MARRVLVVLGIVMLWAGLPPGRAYGATIVAEPIATGLDFPAAFTFAPKGTIFYTERFTGRIMRLPERSTTPVPWYTITGDLCTAGEGGLLGIALHPDWPITEQAFVYATRLSNGVCRNQVIRIERRASGNLRQSVIFAFLNQADRHNGGRVAFGPDGNLWVSTGDNNRRDLVQTLDSPLGKVLRLTTDGAPVTDNPWGTRPWARGFRNVFGFDWDPQTGNLWVSDNGPDCNDELNRVESGGNYGWGQPGSCVTPPAPPVNTNQAGTSPVLPALWNVSSEGITGVVFCDGCRLGTASGGKLFYGSWETGQIRRVSLSADRAAVTGQVVVYTHPTAGAPLAMEASPGGALFFSDPTGIYKLTLVP